MKSLNLKTYLLYALYIVRTNPSILLFLAIFGLLNGITVYLPKEGSVQLINTLTILAAIFISPVIYGIYYEKIEDKYSSIISIFKTYVGGYLLVLFCMYIPIITTTALIMSASSAAGNTGYVMITILIFSLLFIYVIPAYYISGKILESISYGVRFFLGNILNSAPLLMMALFSELLLLLSHFQLESVREQTPALFVTLDFTLYMISSIVDFTLFIMLIYVLRNEDIKKR